jgi:hypothetical protein
MILTRQKYYHIDCLENDNHVKIFEYPTPSNQSFQFIKHLRWTLVFGDFSPHFHGIGYKNINEARKKMEDFVSANNSEVFYKTEDTCTYLGHVVV